MKTYNPNFIYPNEKTVFPGKVNNGKVVQILDKKILEKSWWPSFFPVVISLIVSGGKKETNVMTVACITVMNRDPFMVGFPIFTGKKDQKFQEEKPRYTMDLIKKYKEFTVNLPYVKPALTKAIMVCGSFSGRDKIDKFKKAYLHKINSLKIKTPIITECPLNFECKLHSTRKLGTHTWVIGEVIAIHLDKEFLKGKKRLKWVSLPEVIKV